MKVKVIIDVWDCQARAFLLQQGDFDIPTDELLRIMYFERGGDIPKYGKNIYSILPLNAKKRIEKLSYPVNMSGIRGTMLVDVSEKKLKEFLQG
jgi:hypothetical protein